MFLGKMLEGNGLGDLSYFFRLSVGGKDLLKDADVDGSRDEGAAGLRAICVVGTETIGADSRAVEEPVTVRSAILHKAFGARAERNPRHLFIGDEVHVTGHLFMRGIVPVDERGVEVAAAVTFVRTDAAERHLRAILSEDDEVTHR